jgi:hypothetical protein
MAKKTKWYYYESYLNKDGEWKERSVPQKKINSGDPFLNWENITKSRDNPATRKLKREGYNDGFIGIGHKIGSEYSDTIEWGKQGGRPKKWDSEKGRKQITRLKNKLAENRLLNAKQKVLAVSNNLTDYSPENPRPGSYTYHTSRPASSRERQARYRYNHGRATPADLQILGLA